MSSGLSQEDWDKLYGDKVEEVAAYWRKTIVRGKAPVRKERTENAHKEKHYAKNVREIQDRQAYVF